MPRRMWETMEIKARKTRVVKIEERKKEVESRKKERRKGIRKKLEKEERKK